MPDTEVVLMMRPATSSPALDCSRQWAAACRAGAKVPLRCTLMTASHSPSVMLASIRSRRMPALLTTASRPPKASIAVSIMRFAPSQSATLSLLTTASPPAATISSTTWWAGETSSPVPSRAPPKSLTTTFAPCLARLSACSRPIPRPAPVTIAILPSQSRAMSPTYEHQCARSEPDCFFPEQHQLTAQGLAV